MGRGRRVIAFFSISLLVTLTGLLVGCDMIGPRSSAGNLTEEDYVHEYKWYGPEVITARSYSSDQAHFGCSVSISGQWAIVGAQTGGTGVPGVAYILQRAGGEWHIIQELTSPDPDPLDSFGYSVSISGEYCVVGAIHDDPGGNNNNGAAYIYKKGATNWEWDATILGDAGADFYFGCSVDIYGDYVIVGAYGESSSTGAAYIFYEGIGWGQIEKFTGVSSSDYYGYSVSIFNEYAIVGAYYAGATGSGVTYVYQKQSATQWNPHTSLTPEETTTQVRFGEAVSLSSEYAVIGAPGSDSNSAYIFKREGTTWNQLAKIYGSDSAVTDKFGVSVAITENHAVVGAIEHDYVTDDNSGAIYIFEKDAKDESHWDEKENRFIPKAPELNDNMGNSVAIDGNYAMAGIPNDDGDYDDTGSAYAFYWE